MADVATGEPASDARLSVPQIGDHVCRALVALLAVLFDRPGDDALEFGWDVGVQLQRERAAFDSGSRRRSRRVVSPVKAWRPVTIS